MNTSITRRQWKWDLIVACLQLFFALLLCIIYLVFITSFGGEFLIVIKGLWVLPIFLALLLAGTLTAVILAARGMRVPALQSALPSWLAHLTTRNAWLIGWSIVNLLLIPPILFVGKVLALGALGSVPLFLIGILLIPFLGYSLLFLISSIQTLLRFVRRQGSNRLIWGVEFSGFAFLFAFLAFGLIGLFWNPQWTEGVEYRRLFVPGEEPGRGYRIPAMIVLPGDVLIAFAESRLDPMSDLLDINLVMKRSLDGGHTWSALQVVQDMGNHTVHSPCPVFDRDTQTVWLPFCVDYKRLFMITSTDYGVTWSTPRDLSQELGLPEGTWCHNGPGNGIQMSTGRLVIPTCLGQARILYSDDHGVTWKISEPMTPKKVGTQILEVGIGTEPQVFERVDGALCANLRYKRGKYRIVTCSHDGGETWEPWSFQEDLPDPGTQASIMRFTSEKEGMKNRLLFSAPGAPYRGEFTIRLSYDEGKTWPVSKLVYEGAAGYSQLAVLSDYSILALFETGKYDLRESITLIRVDLDWLTDGRDHLETSLISPFSR
ncbi:MAG: exo-alpha-sialidase [Chloroflexi bacterium]|nr:exo-alpha-sialidase [Chloroflexota bacterium]